MPGHAYSYANALTPSSTAAKYLRYGFVYEHPFEPGQRYRSRRDMEEAMFGYRDLRRQLRCASEDLDWQRLRSPDLEPGPRYTLRNCTIGYTTERLGGNCWQHDFHPGRKTFSTIGNDFEHNPNLKALYRYYGTRRVMY